ncbi:MAG TPA: phospho-sugar mutase [Actinopolymorphaceae bacterium]
MPGISPTTPTDLAARVRSWLDEDPDPATRAELQALIDTGDTGELAARFDGRLEFGTAGLRGALGAGPQRMNEVVVMRAAAGLASYLVANGHAGGLVVVGFDARTNSDVFARDSAEVFAGYGFRPVLFDRPLPTPLVPFAIRHLGAVAGVVVTASHNPAADNGYKVYLGDGSQIVPPADVGISVAIDAVGPLASIPRAEPTQNIGTDEIVAAYLARQRDLLTELGTADAQARAAIRIVYTPLHGVGGGTVATLATEAGFAPFAVPSAQAEPDPAFPTVAFPNPEEPGALDLALALAAGTGADLVLANDPDADRCAVAVPDVKGWRMLRGDEVGVLLGRHLLTRRPGGVFTASIVSSSMLGALAAQAGADYAETLTGFKWIGRVPGLAFGYEEALGYCLDPEYVADKDGMSALLVLADLAAAAKAHGRTLLDDLDAGALAVGVHATDQVSVRLADPSAIADLMRRLRSAPPIRLGGADVHSVDDLAAPPAGGLPPTDGLRLHLRGGGRVIVRPSGTEPKVKAYLEVVEAPAADVDAARARAADRLSALRADVAGLLQGPC